MVLLQAYPPDFVYNILQPNIREVIWMCNLQAKDVKCLECTNEFWNSVLKAWCMYHYEPELSGNQVIWYNSNIRIDGKPVYMEVPHKRGLLYISDLMDGDNKVITPEAAKIQYGLTVMQYNSLITAIPGNIKKGVGRNDAVVDQRFKDYMSSASPAKLVYERLCEIPEYKNNAAERWMVEIGNFAHSEYCQRVKRLSPVVKYQSFQYRFLHRPIITNMHLHRWKVTENNLCTFCQEHEETYQHLFFDCELVTPLYEVIVKLCEKWGHENPSLEYRNVVLADCSTESNIPDLMVIITKQYISPTMLKRCLKSSRSSKK